MQKIKVLIVDDSALVRQTLSEILSSDPQIEVMAAASDPFVAAERMRECIPDVITLDVEMPRMDGITFLQKIMSQCPIPVVMCSSLTEAGSETAMKALEYGAVDIIVKPKMGTKQFIEESQVRICDTVKAAAMTKGKNRPHMRCREVEPKLTADVIIEKPNSKAMVQTTEKVVVVGASTGGTEALRVFLEMLPEDAPGMVIVQHMPEHFTAAFAKRLDSICRVTVKEAADNDSVVRGRALIAPGNRHTLLKRSGARY
jgi:two-component system chemotaxis response regulator CheB